MNAFTANDQLCALTALARAPYEPDGWHEAMELMARAGGGWATQLLGIGPQGVDLHWASGLSSDTLQEFEHVGGAIAGHNPRMAGLSWPAWGIVCDDDYIDAAARGRSDFYQGLFRKYEADFVICARLPNLGGLNMSATVVRTERQGHGQAGDLERLRPLLAPLSAALGAQRALNGQGAALAAGSLEALTMNAFLCDAWGRVVAATAGGEALASRGDVITARSGRLVARDPQANARLQALLRQACSQSPAMPQVILARDAEGRPRRMRVGPLPQAPMMFRSAIVAVITVDAAPTLPAAALLSEAFGLSTAEAEVALGIAGGLSTAEIARRRRASQATVRVQVQAVLQKVGVHKATALAAIVARLGEG